MRYKRIVNNKIKGFTLVEMLVALSISALLFAIAVPSLGALKSQLEEKKYESYKDAVKSAAKLYTQSYKDDLDFDSNSAQSKSLKELIAKDLISDYDDENVTCKTKSEVTIIKSGNKYKYCVKLVCTSSTDSSKEVYNSNDNKGEDDKFCASQTTNPSFTVSISVEVRNGNKRSVGTSDSKTYNTFTTEILSFYNNKTWVKLDRSDDKLETLKISIKPDESSKSSLDSVELLKNNSIIGNGYFTRESENSKKIKPIVFTFDSTKDLTNAILIVRDISNKTFQIKLNVGVDNTPPSCGQFSKNFSRWDRSRTNTFTVDCYDYESGCAKDSYTLQLSKYEDLDKFSIPISDKLGNTTNCAVADSTNDTFKQSLADAFKDHKDHWGGIVGFFLGLFW